MDTTSQTNFDPMHHDYTGLMSLALDGLLSADEARALDQHVKSCPACEAAWLKWQRISHVLTVEPFAGPPQGFAWGVDLALQRDEQRQERILAGLVLVGGTLAVLAMVVLGAALTTALWMAITPAARVQLVETFGFAGQFAALVFSNLTSLRDAVLVFLPSPTVMLLIALTAMVSGAIWARFVFRDPRAGEQ